MRKTIVLEPQVINSLVLNPQAVAAFPFLAQYVDKIKSQGCGSCNKSRFDYLPIISAFQSAPPEQLNTLKKLLDTESIRLIYTAGGKQMDTTV